MGVRNKKKETLVRLSSKTPDARLINEIQTGLNCSPFESEAVLDVVKEVYFPLRGEQSVKAPPGKITLILPLAPMSQQANPSLIVKNKAFASPYIVEPKTTGFYRSKERQVFDRLALLIFVRKH